MKTLYHTAYLDDDTELSIEYTQTPYDPGRTYGPPEDCYPPEGGDVEIINISRKISDCWYPYAATDDEIEKWTQEIEELPIEDDGPDPDEWYDRMRDERMGL
jgi:hypothetical protein